MVVLPTRILLCCIGPYNWPLMTIGLTVDPEVLQAALAQAILRPGPRYRAIAVHIQRMISEGHLATGERLPAERALAVQLGVSRSTVVQAYEILRNAGWARSSIGSGTFAKRAAAASERMSDLVDAGAGAALSGGELINLSISQPQPLLELPAAVRAAAELVGPIADSAEYFTQGYPLLRQHVADAYTERGLATAPEQILITSGGQQALAITAQLLIRPRSNVLIESPTYLGMLDLLRSVRANPVVVPSLAGPDVVATLEETIERTHPSLLFCMATCHTVTGAAMSETAKAHLAELAARNSMSVIDDDILAGLTFDAAQAPLAAYAPAARIITVGATSKLLWNGLRVGWLRAPADLVHRLTRAKGITDLGTSMLAQLVGLHLLQSGAAIGARRVREAASCLDLANRLLASSVPRWRWDQPQGGRSLWIQLPDGADAAGFASSAVQHGASIRSGDVFSADGAHQDFIRLMYVQPEAKLRSGIQRLAVAWADHENRTA